MSTYIASSYVKNLEMAGAQVVPLFYHYSFTQLQDILGKINGVFFPGTFILIQVEKCPSIGPLTGLTKLHIFFNMLKNKTNLEMCIPFGQLASAMKLSCMSPVVKLITPLFLLKCLVKMAHHAL
jgi:hypothetical protein